MAGVQGLVRDALGHSVVKLGEVIKDYTVLTEPQGAAQGQWALASRGGRVYFLKMFLSPKFPQLGGPGSEAIKKRKMDECAAFEHRNRHLHSSLNSTQLGAGNLVVATEFFRVGSTYYKATDVVVGSTHSDLTGLNPHQALVVVRTMLLSIRLLHQAGFVHGDLKPENIVIQESQPGLFVGKVIDYDDGYIVGLPPERDAVVGDQRFYSPELMMYIKGNPHVTGDMLTTASDMFALGLLLHMLFTGRLPHFDRAIYSWAAEAAVKDALTIDGVTGPLAAWLMSLTQVEADKRPLIDDLLYFFVDMTPAELAACLPEPRRPGTGPSVAPVITGTPTAGVLKGTLKRD